MKVLLALHQFLPRHITGTEQYVRALALQMRAEGIDARVFAFEPLLQFDSPEREYLERDEVVETIPVRRVALHHRLSPNFELRDHQNPFVGRLLARHLDEVGYDLVHVFHPRNIGPAVVEEPHARGIPVVVHLMDFWWTCPNYLLLRRDGALCEGPPEHGLGCIPCIDPSLDLVLRTRDLYPSLRRAVGMRTPAGNQRSSVVRQAHALVGRREQLLGLLGTADCVISPSAFLAKLHQQQGLQARRLLLLPYGLDPGRFADMPARKAAPGKPHLDVGYIGSISRHKGVHVLLDALRHVDDAKVRVHIHGSRDSQPGFSEQLVDSIADPRVTFHGPFAPRELGAVLAGLDALVVPSLWYENTPFSVLEALHAGVPVIASDLGGIREIVRTGEGGILFPPGDAEALAAILRRAAADPSRVLAVTPQKPPSIVDNVRVLGNLYAELIGAADGGIGA